MNKLKKIHSTSQHQCNQGSQCQSVSLQNSQILKRKIPQTRVSFLKKIFTQNLRIDEKSPNLFAATEIKKEQEQIRVFNKSNIILHSNKFIEKQYAKMNETSHHLNNSITKKGDDIILKNRKESEKKSYLYRKSKTKNNNKNQIKLRQSKSIKGFKIVQTNPNNLLNTQLSVIKQNCNNEQKKQDSSDFITKNLKLKQKMKKRGITFQTTKNYSIVQNQLKQLKNIGRLLQDIQYKIYKNRSMIIEGIKEEKTISQRRVTKQITFDQTLSLQNSIIYFSSEDVELSNQSVTLTRKVNKSYQNSTSQKPIIQYMGFNKIR